ANGRAKVAAFDLDRGLDFALGGYGDDHEVRAELVGVARARAAARFGAPPDLVLVGDTPRDIEAGRLGGARCVAVATGVFDVAALAAEGADAVLPDLRDTAAVVRAVTG